MPTFENMLDDSIGSFPDVSLGSLGGGPPSTPGPPSASRPRVRSDTASTPVAPKHSTAAAGDNGEEDDGPDDPPTPMAIKTKPPTSRGGVNLTLREQEKVFSYLQ